jgi:acyl-CoA hydrolase
MISCRHTRPSKSSLADLEPPDSMRMADLHAFEGETLTHRLILPRDANHHGTLYAGVLLSLSLEAGYATAFRAAGLNANLVLKRVLDLRCYEPVSVGRVVQIRGREIHRARAQIVVGLWGSSLDDQTSPWMDGLMQFVQVDATGRPEPLDEEPDVQPTPLPPPWNRLRDRARVLLHIRQ